MSYTKTSKLCMGITGLIFLFFTFFSPVRYFVWNVGGTGGSIFILPVFFMVIFGFTILSILDNHKVYIKNEKQLKEINNYIESLDKGMLEESLIFIREMFEYSFLKAAWNNYENSVRRIKSGISNEGEIKEKPYATIEADYFFTDDVLNGEQNLLPDTFHRYIPQMLIALGIFGTFLGLVVGLKGLSFGDAVNTKNSIEILLNGIQISFRTSLYGIAFSIILTVYQNISMGILQNQLNNLCNNIDNLFPMNTQADGINEIYCELEKQTASIQKMSTEIADGVGNKFDTVVQNTLLPTFMGIESLSKQLMETTQKNNHDAISSIVQNIGTIITSSTQQELTNLQSSIIAITENNKAMFEEFHKTISELQKINSEQKSFISTTNNSMNNAERINSDLSELHEKLAGVTDSLNQFVVKQNDSNEDYITLLKHVKENINKQNESNVILSNVMQQNLELVNSQQGIINNVNHTAGYLKQLIDTFPGFLNGLKQNILEFAQLSGNISDKLVNAGERVENTYMNISGSIEYMTKSFDHSIEILDKKVSSQLIQINDNYVAISEKLIAFSQKTEFLVSDLHEHIQAQRSLHELWESYKDSFDKLNGEINTGLATYSHTVAGSLQNIFQEYDNSITAILSKLKATLEEFGEQIEELSAVLDEKYPLMEKVR